MVQWLKRILNRGDESQMCRGCQVFNVAMAKQVETIMVYKEQVARMQSEIDDLRTQRDLLQHSVLRAVRLEPSIEQTARQTVDKMQETKSQVGRSWNKQRADLERKHRRPRNEEADKTAEYWRQKQAGLETLAGVHEAAEVIPQSDKDEIFTDVEELARA